MLKKENLKKAFPYIAAVVIFIGIILVYLSPMLDGKILNQHDSMSWKCMAQEAKNHYETTGHSPLWSNSMFSGMPAYAFYMLTPSMIFFNTFIKASYLWLPDVFSFFWIYLICFFILLKAFKVNTWLSIVGAIAITFSSYFFIIIGAGHNTKAMGIGMMSAVIAGFVLIMKRQYAWGVIATMLFTALGALKHPQMTYYIFMLIGVLAFAELWIAIKEKAMVKYVVGLGIFAASVLIGMGTNYTSYKITNDYVKETMRGGHSELTHNNQNNQQQEGLDLEYATSWSYGTGETMTLLISNFKGGSSNYDVGTNSEIYKTLTGQGVPSRDAENFCKNVPTYWGDQPFTSGSVYVGAVVFFLFVLGLIIVKTPYKWALLFATVASIMLAWGKHFMPLTELFFNYFPLYNKFRAVSSILIVAEICMPLLGILAVKEILDKKIVKQDLIKAIYTAGGITAGICLIIGLLGSSLFDFTSPNDSTNFAQLPQWLTPAIIAERASMLQADAFRAFFFILLGAGTLWLFAKNKLKSQYAVIAALGIFILIDMWAVNRRYLNDDNFLPKNAYDNYFRKTPSEEFILQDKDPNFRVFNLAANTFNDARTSYYLKSAGGYSAAKLRRYQDLIEQHLSKMNKDVLNMLNVKYFIVRSDKQEFVISDLETQQVNRPNPNAMGNAWFVDTLVFVNNPDEECDALNTINLRTTAVADQNIYNGLFKNILNQPVTPKDSDSYIRLTQYTPDVLYYESNSNKNELAVFSEIYYPRDWKAFIDNQPVEIARVNYVLRAINIPAGKHNIRFEFKPDNLMKSEIVSFIFIFLMMGITIGLIVYEVVKKKKNEKLIKNTSIANSKK